MFKRIIRLIYVELIKLLNQRFTYAGLIVVGLGEFLILEFSDWSKETINFNGFEYLMQGLIAGNTIGGFFILILGSMIFSSESTLGTIRFILTRPIRRSEILFAKMFTIVAFSILICVVTFLVGYFFALSRGGFKDMINTTLDAQKQSAYTTDILWAYTGSCLIYSLLPLLAIGCLGLLISIVVNHAPVAVAFSVIIFLFSTISVKMKSNKVYWLFNNYQNFYMETLSSLVDKGTALEIKRVHYLTNIFKSEPFKLFLQFWKWEDQHKNVVEVYKSIYVPVIWIIGFYLLSWFFLVRKEVLS